MSTVVSSGATFIGFIAPTTGTTIGFVSIQFCVRCADRSWYFFVRCFTTTNYECMAVQKLWKFSVLTKAPKSHVGGVFIVRIFSWQRIVSDLNFLKRCQDLNPTKFPQGRKCKMKPTLLVPAATNRVNWKPTDKDFRDYW